MSDRTVTVTNTINRYVADYFGGFYKAQYFQVAALMFYVIVGPLVLKWPKTLDIFLGLAVFNHLLDFVLRRFIFKNTRQYPKGQIISPSILIITGGTFLLVQGYSNWAYLLAGAAGVSSRYLINIHGQPVFNPANLGVLTISLGFPALGSSFADQWVGQTHLIAFMVAIGLATVTFAKKLPQVLAYAGFFLLFTWIRGLFMAAAVTPLTMASLLGAPSILFFCHMMTDPRTSPPGVRGQILFGFCLAAFDIVLRTKQILFPQLIALALLTLLYAVVKLFLSKEPAIAFQSANLRHSGIRVAFASLFFGGLVWAGVSQGPIPLKDPFYSFQEPAGTPPPLNFKFIDKTKDFGLNFTHELPRSVLPNGESQMKFRMVTASVSVGDFDNDGFYDLFFTTMGPDQVNGLYRNLNGRGFEDVTHQWGLADDINKKWPSTGAVFLDIDNDGDQDLVVIRAGCHSLYENTGKHFEDVSEQSGFGSYCSDATAVNFLDYNLDGYLDVYIGNYRQPGILADRLPFNKFEFRIGKTSYNRDGGPNFLLKNLGNGKFKNIAFETNVADTGLNLAIGITDKNADFYPDIYLGNDWGVDNFYFNRGGSQFEDMTWRLLARHTSRNSMSAEMADIDGDGKLEIYATQFPRIGSPIGKNVLWRDSKSGERMVNVAQKLQVDKCGWGWGAKFFDPNNDGKLDLIVANGNFGGTTNKQMWFPLFTYYTLPQSIRESGLVEYSIDQFALADKQPNCLFLHGEEGKPFVDVALAAGITDLDNGRGLATVDFNNDGRMDFVIANHMSNPIFYENQPVPIDTKNRDSDRWVGVKLTSVCNKPVVGTKIYLTCGENSFFKELYPANGFDSQSDDRLHFGLGNCADEKVTIKTVSPYGQKEIEHTVLPNRYTTLNLKMDCS